MELAKINTYSGFSGYFRFIPVTLFFLSFLLISCSDQKVPDTQRAYLTPETLCGTVQFSDGCSPKLDTLIAFGIALIHHMTYEDAEYTFDQVIELDKDCFWGYWGKAMTYIHPLWPDVPDSALLEKGYVVSQNALSLAKTKKEKLYGAAVASFFEDGLNKSKPARLEAFKNGWMTAREELPEDIEARMFSVLTMLATVSPNDKSYKVQREAGETAEKVLEIIPDHPAGFHYAIHAYDVPLLSGNAIRVAKNYYKIAPELPHALHMPTHIFTRLGYWDESIELNSRSAVAALRYPVGDQISGHYFHALDYLAYAYLQNSELEKAKNIVAVLDTLGGTYQPVAATAYCLAAVPGRVLLENQMWSEAANLSLNNHTNFAWNKFPQYEALIYYAKGIGAARSKNIEVTEQSLQRLEELQKTFLDAESNRYWISQIEIQKKVVKAWELFAQNEMEKSLMMMISAADLEDATEKNPVTPGQLLPAREMLGDLLLEMNKPKEALKQYELTLEKNPNRLNALFGAGKSAELIGDKEKAAFYFTALLKNNKSSKSNNERIAHALEVTTKI
jgi:tetratricopeptide (TPR) repeat protein